MKKRIIAILLALSVFAASLSCGKHASADPVTIAVIGSICAAAVSIMAFTTTGEYQKVADDFMAAADWVGSGLSYTFTGNNVYDSNGNLIFHEDSEWMTGMSIIANGLQDMFYKGEVTLDDDGVLAIKQHLLGNLISEANQAISVMARPKVDFTAGYNCAFYSVDLSKPFALKSIPLSLEFSSETIGQSITPVFFDESRIIFSEYFHTLRSGSPTEELYRTFYLYKATSTFQSSAVASHCTFIGTHSDFCDRCNIYFLNTSLSTTSVSYTTNWVSNPTTNQRDYTFQNCFVYENGTVTYTPISEVDVSEMNSGILVTTGKYWDFLRTIDDYSISTEDVPKLDDLSGVVPDDATLSIPINPDKDIPIENQVGVSVPGVGDFTLAELQGDLNLDINVPSGITTKFPFCIPFDFVRFLGLLCSEPVAPVFRIPISTHPDNLGQWAENQTIGEYIDPDYPPLFDIDEEIVIDLSHIPLVQPICYTCFIIGWIFLLLHITPKMIQH